MLLHSRHRATCWENKNYVIRLKPYHTHTLAPPRIAYSLVQPYPIELSAVMEIFHVPEFSTVATGVN